MNQNLADKRLEQIIGQERTRNQADSAVESNAVIVNPFSHPRTLLKDFIVAEKLLQHAFGTLLGKKLMAPAPAVVIHPMEKTEGGLTEVERKAFRELAMGAGARAVVVHEGEELYPRSIKFEALLEKETADSGLQTKPRSNLVTTLLLLVTIGAVFLYIMSVD